MQPELVTPHQAEELLGIANAGRRIGAWRRAGKIQAVGSWYEPGTGERALYRAGDVRLLARPLTRELVTL